MIEVLPGFPDNVAAYRIGGHLSKADYEVVLADIKDRYTRHRKLSSYVEVTADFHGVDPAALWEDLRLGVEHFFDWDRFAVVTDADWLTRGMKLWALLLPLHGRTYSTSEADDARAWISEA